ncbi:hypothetical protein R3W88_003890 [Solanum pinnatisectum]|uniref:Uncharacterized protein n=1 Tax=Solanum pinnatisectum TaxID=50273 RepID=A0AAV9MQW7_9SOLN|nr:hypothetical protein R3W88_003890 [Solanum pinnatisectum]
MEKVIRVKKHEHGDRVQIDKERTTDERVFREQRRRYGYKRGYQNQIRKTTQIWHERNSQVNVEVTTKNKFGALEGKADKQDSFTQNAEEGIKIIPIQQKAVTQQEENRRESETWSSNFHLKEDNIGLEQIDRSEYLIDKDTSSNDIQLEARKSMTDKKKEWGKGMVEMVIEVIRRTNGGWGYVGREGVNSAERLQSQLNTLQIIAPDWIFITELKLSHAGNVWKSKRLIRADQALTWRTIEGSSSQSYEKHQVGRISSFGYFQERDIYPICKGFERNWIGSFRPIQVFALFWHCFVWAL